MGALLSRFVVLESKTKQVVELKVSRQYAPPGDYAYTNKLDHSNDKEIPATKFHQEAMDASRATVIHIFLDGVDSKVILTPQYFIEYRRITFGVDKIGKVKVSGVRATGFIDQLCRIRLASALIRAMRYIMGDDDRGDEGQEVEII